jgi:hypothetical protein
MPIQVELSPEKEARLAAEAVLRGLAPEQYAGKLLAEALTPHSAGTGILTPERFDRMLKVLTRGAENLPILPPEVNERASYYEDHL